jgi:hypothetical protein
MSNKTNFYNLFPNPQILDNYINSNQPIDIKDNKLDYTLLMFVCSQILNSQPIQPWINLSLKMLSKYTPEQLSLNFENKDGVTALILVSGVDNEVTYKILSFGPEACNINAIEKDNKMNALMYACSQETEETAIEMLSMKPYINISLNNINKNGYTPLMLACEEGLEQLALTMLEDFEPSELNLMQENNSDQDALGLARQNNLITVYQLIREILNEQDSLNNMLYEEDDKPSKKHEWATREKPNIPSFEKQVIDINEIGIDSIYYDNKPIKDYLNENKEDNIVILYEGKNYLLTKSIIKQQWNDGIVYECVNGLGGKDYSNIYHNLPLFNIKMIGIEFPIDKTGLWPEFIYLDGFTSLLESNEQLFSVVPLVDTMLISVVSLNEVKTIGLGTGTAIGALHCQSGQGGMAGIIVPATTNIIGGKKFRSSISKKNKPTYKSKKGKKQRYNSKLSKKNKLKYNRKKSKNKKV